MPAPGYQALTSPAHRHPLVTDVLDRVSRPAHVIACWQSIRGTSMTPALVEGDEVLLEPLRAPPRRGDVVVFRRRAGGLAIHRVVSVRGGAVQTWGDACPAPDPTIPPGAVLLVATRLRRRGLESPIPAPGWRARLLRARSLPRRALARLGGAPGRWWRARPSSSTSRGGGSSA